jgi:hypothetical protein
MGTCNNVSIDEIKAKASPHEYAKKQADRLRQKWCGWRELPDVIEHRLVLQEASSASASAAVPLWLCCAVRLHTTGTKAEDISNTLLK